MLLAFLCCCIGITARTQTRREDIYTGFVLYQKRVALEKDLRERIIGRSFAMPLDSSTEDRYLSACQAVSQFLFDSPEVMQGFDKLFAGYSALSDDTKNAFLEAVYAVAPGRYTGPVRTILENETDPKRFSICAVYLFRADTTTGDCNALKIAMVEKFPGYDSIPILLQLQQYLTDHSAAARSATPDIAALFTYHRGAGQKIVYSFQRWDRDYPGLAIVMDEYGHFVRDGQGRVQMFRQLARSGSDLPYFITNGSTPQGIFSITGTGVSRTNFIGPTPNLQLLMPFEQGAPAIDTVPGLDSLDTYLSLMPPLWRGYAPMMESRSAGRIGRTEIIAHGTTIDPEFFKNKPFYPLTPTMGCLCAKEQWNPTTGHLLVSEQFNLVSAFLSTPARKGYLFVINVGNQHSPVSRSEIETWIKRSGESIILVQ